MGDDHARVRGNDHHEVEGGHRHDGGGSQGHDGGAAGPAHGETAGWSRRQFIGAGAAAAAALTVPTSLWLPETADAAQAASLTGTTPLRAAMHVHGSWSEGKGSWEAQFLQASKFGVDVLYMSDHDMRATADNYLTSLSGIKWDRSTTGSLARQASSASGSSIHLLAESSSATAAASVTMTVQPKPMAFDRLRTSIAGQKLEHTVSAASLSGGATYEIVLDLSFHPAGTGRPAGQYRLIYRYGVTSPGSFTENGGLTGVVGLSAPSAGSVQTLSPESDVTAIWPSMLAIDNAMFGLAFTVRSPHSGAVADVTVGGVRFLRSQSTPDAVRANQAHLVETYQPKFPAVTVYRTTEISKTLPDMNPFGIPQYFPDYANLPADHDTRYAQIVSQVHAQGGLISWNHPFGYNEGPLLSAADRILKRRQVFSSMLAVKEFGVDIVEVGYILRGNVDAATHIGLWDTFSRNGTFLTGNGTSDDHGGQFWKGIMNGFVTGVWAASRSDADLKAALASGRAFAAHLGRWPGGEVDLLVDGSVPMGSVSVSTTGTTRSMSVWLKNPPAGATIQVIGGPVDYTGNVNPGTVLVRTLSPSAFTGGGTVTFSVNTATSRFYRVQVLASDGAVVGTSNPVWLLRSDPPGGIPAPRRH